MIEMALPVSFGTVTECDRLFTSLHVRFGW